MSDLVLELVAIIIITTPLIPQSNDLSNNKTWASSFPSPSPAIKILFFQVDVGTSTDASTLTEPENLGACEPGTSVNLEGIVWHETDTGKYKTRHQIQSNRKTIFYYRNYFPSDTTQRFFHSQPRIVKGNV